ncbi:MAG: RHS repeat-associated core domain-containing protein, partial [Syntrophaceae bacterium]|nr:RHS repeat-associated core domain-containing protein [Syntrophaceae bacterium]
SGQFFDNEIGQYHLRARQYDPYISRFTSRDPADGKFEEPMSFHRYLYCFNNPINMIDPLGLDAYLFFDPKGKEGFLEPQGHVTVGVDNRKGGIITRYAANGRLNPIDTRNSLKEAVNWYTSGDDIYVTFKNRVDEKGISSDSRIRAYINYDRKPFLNPYPYCSTYAKAALASGGYDMGFGAGVSPVDLMAAAIERAAFGSIFRGRDEDIEVSDKAVYWYYRTIDWMDDYVGI